MDNKNTKRTRKKHRIRTETILYVALGIILATMLTYKFTSYKFEDKTSVELKVVEDYNNTVKLRITWTSNHDVVLVPDHELYELNTNCLTRMTNNVRYEQTLIRKGSKVRDTITYENANNCSGEQIINVLVKTDKSIGGKRIVFRLENELDEDCVSRGFDYYEEGKCCEEVGKGTYCVRYD